VRRRHRARFTKSLCQHKPFKNYGQSLEACSETLEIKGCGRLFLRANFIAYAFVGVSISDAKLMEAE